MNPRARKAIEMFTITPCEETPEDFENIKDVLTFIEEEIRFWRGTNGRFPNNHSYFRKLANQKEVIENLLNSDTNFQAFLNSTKAKEFENFFHKSMSGGTLYSKRSRSNILRGIAEDYSEDVFRAIHDSLLSPGAPITINARTAGGVVAYYARMDMSKEVDSTRYGLENLKSQYEIHMQLKAPAKYWKDKSLDHKQNKRRFLGVFGVLLLFGLGAVFPVWAWVNAAISEIYLADNQYVSPMRFIPYTSAILFSIVLYFWGLRLVVRLFLSHQHLEIKCGEKGVMIDCFQALLKERAISTEDKTVLLQALFSSSTDGIVKDDAAPITSLA